MAVYLGFDSSTQSLTVTAISIEDGRHSVLFERSLAFDEALPAYGTRHGVVTGRAAGEVHAPPLMWAEALDLMMQGLAQSGIDLNRVRAVCGAAQQHGSVYLREGAGARFASLYGDRPLASQIQDIWARATAPVWLDTSTTDDCAAITTAPAAPMSSRAEPDRGRSSASLVHRSTPLPGGSRRITPTPNASTWSARSWRPCWSARMRRWSRAMRRG